MSNTKATVKSTTAQLEGLVSGQTLLLQAIKTKNEEKVQLEFAEKMTNTDDNAGALLGMFNASDDRFSSGARRSWLTAQIAEVGKLLNINCGPDADWVVDEESGKEILPIGIMNPEVAGKRFRVKVIETTTPDEYQAENVETSAKRKGKEGEYITSDGHYVFSNTEVVLKDADEAPEHFFLTSDAVSSKEVSIKEEVGF